MLEFLANISIIFILLALFGFYIKDAYKKGEVTNPPFMYKGEFQSFCHYTSFSLFILSFLTIIFFVIFFAPNENNVISQTLFKVTELSLILENQGVLTIGFTEYLVNLLFLLFFPAMIFCLAYSVAFSIGRLKGYINNNWVRVYFSNEQYEEYPRIISDDSDFITFEDNKKDCNWISFKKKDIIELNSIDHPSKFDTYKESIKDKKFYYLRLLLFFIERFAPLFIALIIIISAILL